MDALKQQDGESLNVIEENIEALRAIMPDAFTEDGIDFDALRQLLGDQIADGEEKYGLTWHGKKRARQIALTPSTATLRPCSEESADWDKTRNIFIEGDNLEVLKLLQKSYAGKVKMICPSSDKMGHQSGLSIGGSGSVVLLIMPPVFDVASGVGGLSFS